MTRMGAVIYRVIYRVFRCNASKAVARATPYARCPVINAAVRPTGSSEGRPMSRIAGTRNAGPMSQTRNP